MNIHLKGIPHLKTNFCAHIEDKIIRTFVLTNFFLDLFPTLFWTFSMSENKTLDHGRNPSWLYRESVMALQGIRQGARRNPSPCYEELVTDFS